MARGVCAGVRARVHACGLEVGGVSRRREQRGQRPWDWGKGTGCDFSTPPPNLHGSGVPRMAGEIPQEHSDEGSGWGCLLKIEARME